MAWAASSSNLARSDETWPVSVAPPTGDDTEIHSRRGKCLSSVAVLCGRDDLEVKAILAEIVRLLPSGMPGADSCACRIELDNASYWSPAYRKPAAPLEQPLKIGGATVGSITLGGRVPHDAGSRDFLTTAGEIVSQMLARRADRERLDKQDADLEQRDAQIEQMRRLANLGEWAFDPHTRQFSWSDEARRIAGLGSPDDESTPEREKAIGSLLLGAVNESLPARRPIEEVLPCTTRKGEQRWLHAVGEVEVVDARPVRAFGILRDVTNEKETEFRLSRLANHDTLTGLANRRQLLDRLDEALLRGRAGAVLLIDVDNFKDVNDTNGHDVGDALLKALAKRLEALVQKPSLVARLGGDEFVVMLPNKAETSIVERWARQLLEKAGASLSFAGQTASIQLSAGLTMFPADGNGSLELLKNADLAMYAAKGCGGGTVVSYDTKLRDESRRRLEVCAEVTHALTSNQFVPYYQPKVCLASGALVGFEALLRWNHPSGVRSPGAIKAAFDVPELSRALCGRMLERIAHDLASWQSRRMPFGRVAFNASSSEFSGFDLVNRVLGRLKSFDLAPSCLGLEVTETVFLGGSTDSISGILTQLHDAGVEIALDDFGTGYASLTHLQEYPVDVIKIDQTFIQRLTTDAASHAITSVVLGLGKNLGMKVVAEGVETAEQAQCLKAGGCDQVQGYFFGRPMPAENVPGFVSSWAGATNALTRASPN